MHTDRHEHKHHLPDSFSCLHPRCSLTKKANCITTPCCVETIKSINTNNEKGDRILCTRWPSSLLFPPRIRRGSLSSSKDEASGCFNLQDASSFLLLDGRKDETDVLDAHLLNSVSDEVTLVERVVGLVGHEEFYWQWTSAGYAALHLILCWRTAFVPKHRLS